MHVKQHLFKAKKQINKQKIYITWKGSKKQHRKLCVINQTCDKHKKKMYII